MGALCSDASVLVGAGRLDVGRTQNEVVGFLFPSQPVGHQSTGGKRQKERQKVLYATHEHGGEASRRQSSVNQLNFISQYKECIGLESLETDPDCIGGAFLRQSLVCGSVL